MERTTVMPRVSAATGPGRRRGWRTAIRWADALVTWLERDCQRRALLKLDERMLRDIGLSRADVEQEAEKPFWRL
jgi:uncharacterized protein YjiS (DUF1127 family)